MTTEDYEIPQHGADQERDRFFSLSLDLLCIAGMDGYFKRVNAAWEYTIGYSTQELLDRPYIDFVHPDDRESTYAEGAKLRDGALTLQFSNRYRCKNGSYKWLAWKAVPALGDGLIYAVARDTTAEKIAEQQLLEKNRRLEIAVKAEHDANVALQQALEQRDRAEKLLRENNEHFKLLAERNRLLVQEVEHRVGNNLSALIGLVDVMRGKEPDADAFASAIHARLMSMAHFHRTVASGNWQDATVRSLTESTLNAMQSLAFHTAAVELLGPDIPLDHRQAYALTLILGELFTNSVKYGAHRVAGGRIQIAWSVFEKSGENWTEFRWAESGGPPPPATIQPSLGTHLVEQLSAKELGGDCAIQFLPKGVAYRIKFPGRRREA